MPASRAPTAPPSTATPCATAGASPNSARRLTNAPTKPLDAQGLSLLPGVIDPHVHFREPGNEYKEDLGSGSRAAVRGGVTSFLEMPNTEPPTVTRATLADKLARAAKKSVANYGFFHRRDARQPG